MSFITPDVMWAMRIAAMYDIEIVGNRLYLYGPLQDFEAGRPMELEAIVGAVVELGERLGVPMPATQTVYACAKMLDEKRRR